MAHHHHPHQTNTAGQLQPYASSAGHHGSHLTQQHHGQPLQLAGQQLPHHHPPFNSHVLAAAAAAAITQNCGSSEVSRTGKKKGSSSATLSLTDSSVLLLCIPPSRSFVQLSVRPQSIVLQPAQHDQSEPESLTDGNGLGRPERDPGQTTRRARTSFDGPAVTSFAVTSVTAT